MLSNEEIAFFRENGYLRLRAVFSADEVAELSRELDHVMEHFCVTDKGWEGPWRDEYLSEEEEARSQLISTHELELYSQAWTRAAMHPRLAESIADLLESAVEFHHMTLHAKGADFGAPFPMHQDHPFYPHETGAYIDAIVHVDDADEQRGCLKFLPGSHKQGPLEHNLAGSPHLPTDKYRLEDAVSCPADAGDVVLFSIHTIHGSALNRSDRIRRVVRIGYRDPRNRQVDGQGMGRPGFMVHGLRPNIPGVRIEPYPIWPQPTK